MISFNNIDGTPTMYMRTGDGQRYHTSFQATQGFYNALVQWIRDLRWISSDSAGYPDIEFVTSAGAYVNKPGQHGAGTAFDFDEVKWLDRWSRPINQDHASGEIQLRRRYLALDAVVRRHFRFSLDGWYDAAHRDHIHGDFGGLPTVCQTGSRSDTVFVQASMNNFMGSGMAVDGQWGPITDGAFQESIDILGVPGNPHTQVDAWRFWLTRCAHHGFNNVNFGQA